MHTPIDLNSRFGDPIKVFHLISGRSGESVPSRWAYSPLQELNINFWNTLTVSRLRTMSGRRERKSITHARYLLSREGNDMSTRIADLIQWVCVSVRQVIGVQLLQGMCYTIMN